MAKVTPEEYQEKHARRLKASVPDIQRGVERVTRNPMEQAAAKKDKMLANLTAAVTDGKWERGLKKFSLEDWKSKMVNKGVQRLSSGIDGARDKVIEFAGELLPHVDAGVSKVKGMPDLTIEDSIQRSATFIRHMAGFRRS